MFDAGALLFKIQSVGKALFVRDMSDSKTAVKDLEKATTDAAKAADGQADAQDKVTKKTREAVPEQRKQTESSKAQADAAKQLSVALLAGGVALSALIGIAVAKNTEFDAAMSNTAAAIMATKEQHEQLGEAALQAGADTAYSASEAAAAEEELAKAGLKVSDIVGGSLNGSLALAAAGQLQVARSAEIMATTLTQFRLPAEQAAHVSDVLAAGAGKAQGSVDDLALALSYVGPLAGSVGFSLEETAGTIAYFATQGIIGEKAGTSLRGVLASLQSPSALADKEMKKYSISMFDANGNMLSLAGIADQLQDKLGGLTEQERLAALGRIFGNESLNAATLLYEGGAKAVNQWTDEVNESGYAATQAAKRQDNLAGDIEKLGGAMDTALIKTGSAANDVLRQMVQAVTALVDWYGELPEPVQAAALGLGVAAAAALLFSGAAVGLRVKLIELKTELDKTNFSFGKTALTGAAAGIALTGVITIVGLLMAKQAEAAAKAESYADAIADSADAVHNLSAANLSAERSFLWMSQGSAADAAKKLGINLDDLALAIDGDREALKNINSVIDTAIGGVIGLSEGTIEQASASVAAHDAAVLLRGAIDEETAAMTRGQEIANQRKQLTKDGADVTRDATDAYVEQSGAVEDLSNQLWDLIDAISEANGTGQDAISANIDYKNVLADVDEQIQNARDGVEGYALGLDENTQAGRDNMDMLVDLAQKGQEAADKQFALTGNTDEYWAALEASRQAVIDRATALGMNADEAQNLADKIAAIPNETEWKAIVDTAAAATQLQAFMDRWNNSSVTVRVQQSLSYAINSGSVGGIPSQTWNGNADGGFYPVQFFAGGGVREDHRAQMVRAGSWRVFGEPETGGESYIPHAQSKRTTAVPVLRQTAGLMGYDLVPKGQQSRGLSIGSLSVGVHASPGMNEAQLSDKVRRVFETEIIPMLEEKMK